MGVEAEAERETLGGITLEQFAGVTGAHAEGISLDEVLAQEQIDAGAWPAAKRLWTKAIAESVSLQVQLHRARRVVQDCLVRAIRPLQEDEGSAAPNG